MPKRNSGILITLCVIAALSCKQESKTATDTSTTASTTAVTTGGTGPTAPMTTLQVTLSFSGAVHLDPDVSPPFIIVPNFKGASHDSFIAADKDAVAPGGLPNTRKQFDDDAVPVKKQIGDFMWGDIPPSGIKGVTIDLAASGVKFSSPVSMDLGDASKDTCPNPPDAASTTKPTSLHWLPRLWRVSKAKGPLPLKKVYTAAEPDSNDVAARLVLDGGTLQTQLGPSEREYTFPIGRPAPDDITQTVAMSLDYTFTVDVPASNPIFVLKGREFKTSKLVDLGTFKPFTGTNRIVINVINMPINEFFDVHDTKSLPHFDLHYRLIDGAHNEAKPVYVKKDCIPAALKPLYECGPTG